MDWNKKRLQTLCLLLGLLLLFGCAAKPALETSPATPPEASVVSPAQEITAQETQAPDAAKGIRFTDMGGNEIVRSAPATRIVALTPADVEILYAIGAGDTIIGCGEYCDYPAEAASIPVMQTGVELNMEQLLAAAPVVLLLNPQMLSTSAAVSTQAQVERLSAAGVQIVISNALDIAGVYEAIEMLGVLTGNTDGAEAVVTGMREAFASVSAIDAARGKSVYFEISPLEYGLWTAGTHTFMDEIAGMLGLTNCFADVTDYGEISEEQVLARNPDYIVTISMYFGEGPTPAEEIASRPGWQNVSAVQNGAILNLRNNELSRPGPRLAEGAKLLGDLLRGEG